MSQTGTLMIRVFTSQAQIPIEGATVVVTGQDRAGKLELISVQATDSSGMIRPLKIETPGSAESTQPNGLEGGVPFTLCNVWAEHPGFAMLQIEGVQIFPGVETVQDMELVPLAQDQIGQQRQSVRDISAQNL